MMEEPEQQSGQIPTPSFIASTSSLAVPLLESDWQSILSAETAGPGTPRATHIGMSTLSPKRARRLTLEKHYRKSKEKIHALIGKVLFLMKPQTKGMTHQGRL